jgi:hypothetical protein
MRLAPLQLLAVALLIQLPSFARAEQVDSRESYIVNGQPVGAGQAHATVGLLLLDEEAGPERPTPSSILSSLSCSGVLIASSVVITAAHCVDACEDVDLCGDGTGAVYRCEDCTAQPRDPSTLYIAAGLRTVDDAWRAEVVPVREVILHDGYRDWPDWDFDWDNCWIDENTWDCAALLVDTALHDIAILRLDAPITALQPVGLLGSQDLPGATTGLAQGYGRRLPYGSDSLLSQAAYRSLLNQTQSPIERTGAWQIATGGGPDRSDACFGDSGGPLYVRNGVVLAAAGVASLLRTNDEGEACKGTGTMYTSVPAHAEWIYEQAPETNPFRLAARGGCSVVPGSRSQSAAFLFGALLLCTLARRRNVLLAAGLAFIVVPSGGCGAQSDSSSVSFCTEQYDPRDAYCDRSDALDLQAAEALARLEVPNDAWLWQVLSHSMASVGPDGEAPSWVFSYYLPGRTALPNAEFVGVSVSLSQTLVTDNYFRTVECIPSEPLEPLDSRRLIHDTIQFLEAQDYPFVLDGTAALRIVQDHVCSRRSSFPNYITFRDHAVFFDATGVILGLAPVEAIGS